MTHILQLVSNNNFATEGMRIHETAPTSDEKLLDAYSQAVISVVEKVSLKFCFQRLEQLGIHSRFAGEGNFAGASNFAQAKFLQHLDNRNHFTWIADHFYGERILGNVYHPRSKNLSQFNNFRAVGAACINLQEH